VNQHKKQLQTEITNQENLAKPFLGTQKAFEANVENGTAEPDNLTIEQQLILLDLALQQELFKTEEKKINNFIPKN